MMRSWRAVLALLGAACGAVLAQASAQAQILSGTIHYTGTHGAVSADQAIQLFLLDPLADDELIGSATLSRNGGAFRFGLGAPGDYHLAYALGTGPEGEGGVGQPASFYDHHATPPGDPIHVPPSGRVDLTLDFGDTLISGIAGNVTYTGAAGLIGPRRRLSVLAFTDPNCHGESTEQSYDVRSNGGRFDLLTFDTDPYYLVAFFDLNRNGDLDPGEPAGPCIGPVVAGPSQTAIALTFGGPPGAIRLGGTVRYTGTHGPVSASQPIQLYLLDPQADNKLIGAATVSTNAGAFMFSLPAAGDYHLAYALGAGPEGEHLIGQPSSFYDDTVTPWGDPIHVPPSGRTDLAIAFGDSRVSGIAGTVTYAGTLGTVSPHQPLSVLASTDSSCGNDSVSQSYDVGSNGGRFDLLTFDANAYYLLPFFDMNGNGDLDVGEPAGRCTGPIVAAPDQTAVDLVFGGALPSCLADCNGDTEVTVDELITVVGTVLGTAEPSACSSAIPGSPNLALIIQAVNNALQGC